MAKKKSSENMLELDGLTEDTVVQEELIERIEKQPKPFSMEWEKYVMSQFSTDELDNGNPRVHGLRRVSQNLIGPIINSQVKVHQSPNNDNSNRAVVSYSIAIIVTNGMHPAHGNELTLEDVADVSKDNTNYPFHLHSTATAATKAEARILRKLLGIKNISAEEVFDKSVVTYEEEPQIEGAATPPQINVMDLLMQRLNVNGSAFLSANGFANVKQLKEEDVYKLTKMLNEFSAKGVDTNLSGYNQNWRN